MSPTKSTQFSPETTKQFWIVKLDCRLFYFRYRVRILVRESLVLYQSGEMASYGVLRQCQLHLVCVRFQVNQHWWPNSWVFYMKIATRKWKHSMNGSILMICLYYSVVSICSVVCHMECLDPWPTTKTLLHRSTNGWTRGKFKHRDQSYDSPSLPETNYNSDPVFFYESEIKREFGNGFLILLHLLCDIKSQTRYIWVVSVLQLVLHCTCIYKQSFNDIDTIQSKYL